MHHNKWKNKDRERKREKENLREGESKRLI